MKLAVTITLLAIGLTTLSDATFIFETAAVGTASTVGLGTAAGATALAGIGGLVLGAGLIGALVLARRGKRSVENALKEDAVFSLVSASDTVGCAMKLVCMLEAKEDEALSEDDKFILNIFGRAPEAPSIEKMKSPRGAYDYAAFMGHKFGVDACEELFHTCTASYETMITYVAQLRA